MLFSSVLGAAILDARKCKDQAPFADTAGKGSQTGWHCSYLVHENRLGLINATHPMFRERIEKLDSLVADRLDDYTEQQYLAERFLKVRKRLPQ